MDLKGKVVLVTGGAVGIGRAYCEEFVKQGSKVSICDINTDESDDLIELLTNKYGKDRVIFCQCDVTDYMQFEEAFQTTISTFGTVDIVINNAAVMNDRFWELEVDVNLNGVIRGMLLAFRFMGRDRGGRGGIIINTGSNVCFRPFVSIPIYTATKHAIVGITRSYGAQYHVNITGVKVIALCPAATDTKLVKDIKKQLFSPDYESAWKQDISVYQPQKAEHVAKSLIQVLHKASSGSCWLVENSQPPKEIPHLSH